MSITTFSMADTIVMSEAEARQRPTAENIKETKILLYDFYIKTEIPTFQSLSQLLLWRRTIINKALS